MPTSIALSLVAALVLLVPESRAAGSHARAGGRAGALSISRLRWDGRDRPLGYIQFEPRIGWVVSSPERGQRQTAYQILVASSPDRLQPGRADVWDSKKIVSAESINVHYDGPAPNARQRAYWTVRVWDRNDRPSAFAPPSWWEFGLLDEEWEGQWIGRAPSVPSSPNVYDQSVTHLRKTFSLTKPIQRARLYASAFGLYELSLNGKRAGDQVLAPGYSDYEKRVLWQAYDVTALVRRGLNAIGAIVAGGWCTAALGGRAGACGTESARVMVQLEILSADGTLQTIISDKSWKAHGGPIISAHLVKGETYDARLEMPGWDTPQFHERGWGPVGQYDKKIERDLVADAGPPIAVTHDVRPVQLTEPRKGTFVFDLGEHIVGRARLRGTLGAGTTVTLRYGEHLQSDGTIAVEGAHAAKSTDRYTARGHGTQAWEARFAIHAFRYVEVTGLRARPPLDAITGRVLQSVTPVTGRLDSSDDAINRLFKSIGAAQRGAFLSVPTGPHRDEAPGTLLDAGVFAGTACLAADVQGFYRKWIDDIRDAQLPDASYSATAPAVELGSARRPGGAGAAAAGVLVPWALFRCYADRTPLDAHLPSMGRWLNHFRASNPGLVWSAPAPAAEPADPLGTGSPTDPSLLGTAQVAQAAEALAQIMRHAGPNMETESRAFAKLAHETRTAFARAFLLPDGRLKSDTQTAYAVALGTGALPAAARDAAGKQLVAAIERSAGHLTTGLLGTAHVMNALSQIGRDDLAYRLLLEVNPGAHYAFGAVGEWMYDAIGGIALDPGAPAGRHVLVRPRPGGGLTAASARYDSLHGPIATAWKQDGRSFRLKVSVPANSTATVTLPYPGAALESGVPVTAAVGVRVLPSQPGRAGAAGSAAVMQIESGSYEFVVPMTAKVR